MKSLEKLYELAGKINDSWNDQECVDWNEAEELVRECEEIPGDLLGQLPYISEIINYTKTHKDWDSAEVAAWPDLILSELERADKQFGYREDGENWEVFSLSFTGEEEWKATVETEFIAESLVKMLSPAL